MKRHIKKLVVYEAIVEPSVVEYSHDKVVAICAALERPSEYRDTFTPGIVEASLRERGKMAITKGTEKVGEFRVKEDGSLGGVLWGAIDVRPQGYFNMGFVVKESELEKEENA